MGKFRETSAPLITLPAAAAVIPFLDSYDLAEKAVSTGAAVMVNGVDVFKIEGGPIIIRELISVCVTANSGTGSTLQWQADGTDGAAATITGATTTLASVAAGTIIVTQFTALTTAPAIYLPAAGGVGITRPTSTAHGIVAPAGIIEMVIGTGSTTGTWRHYMRYTPMARGVVVTALF